MAMNAQLQDLVNAVEEKMIDAVKSLPDGSATVEIQEFENPKPTRASVALVPVRNDASPLTVYVTEGVPQLVVLVGEAGVFEVPMRDALDRDALGKLEQFIRTVIRGSLSETVWKRGNKVVRSRLTMGLGGDEVTSEGRAGGKPFGRTRRTDLDWKPYQLG